MTLIKVAADSRTSKVAGAIAGVIRENHHAEVQAIGAGSVNQTMKAIIIAKSYLAGDGIQIAFTAEFADVLIEDVTRTAIKFIIDPSPEIPEG